MNLYVGTSGFSYAQWKGSFYPEGLPAKEMLRYYGGRFSTVEINNTFHRMPSPALLAGWAGEVPAGFRFALKAPMRITHQERLRGSEESVSYFLQIAGGLRERLGPLLFQFPPDFPKDLPRLRGLFLLIPDKYFRVACEFRHPSWFDPEIYALLEKHRAALCVAETDDGIEVPLVRTADWGYLRLRRAEYGVAELKKWVGQVREQQWQEVFVYFKHEELANGPRFANRFLELAG